LMVEVWNGALFGLEDLCTLLKEIITRQQNLSPVVAKIKVVTALFDNGKHCVDDNAIARATQNFQNIVTKTKAKLLSAHRTKITHQPLFLGRRRHGLPTLIESGLGPVRRHKFQHLWPPYSSDDRQLKFVKNRGNSAYPLIYINKN